MSHCGGSLGDQNAKNNVDGDGWAHEVSEGCKDCLELGQSGKEAVCILLVS